MRTRLWIAFVLVSLPLTVLVGWGIGLAATPAERPFAWSVAALAATAAGTLSLAVVTGVLAVMTAREVRLTSSIESERHRPVLVEASDCRSPEGFSLGGDGLYYGQLRVGLRNVGLGPALNVRVTAVGPGAVAGATIKSIGVGRADTIAVEIAGSEPVRINIPLTMEWPDASFRADDFPLLGAAFTLSLTCMDRTRTEILDALVRDTSQTVNSQK